MRFVILIENSTTFIEHRSTGIILLHFALPTSICPSPLTMLFTWLKIWLPLTWSLFLLLRIHTTKYPTAKSIIVRLLHILLLYLLILLNSISRTIEKITLLWLIILIEVISNMRLFVLKKHLRLLLQLVVHYGVANLLTHLKEL